MSHNAGLFASGPFCPPSERNNGTNSPFRGGMRAIGIDTKSDVVIGVKIEAKTWKMRRRGESIRGGLIRSGVLE